MKEVRQMRSNIAVLPQRRENRIFMGCILRDCSGCSGENWVVGYRNWQL